MASNQNTLKRALATRRQRTSRANSEDVCLDSEDPSPKATPRLSTKATPGLSPKASPRQRRHTKFDIHDNDDHQSDDGSSKVEGTLIQTDQSGEKQSRNWCFFCRIQVESKTIRLLFRFCAIFNILSLVFSAPLFICPKNLPDTPSLPLGSSRGGNLSSNEFDGLQNCNKVFIQYALITVVDFLLAVFYTLQTLARIEYLIYLRRTKSRKSLEVPEIRFGPDNSPIKDESYGSILRLINLIIITLALWYSVSIGVYRTYVMATNRADPQIHWAYYWGLPFRMLSLFTAVKLLRYLALIKSSNFREILDNIQKALNNLKKNKKRFYQLLVVTLFYLFFIYVFALVGVQWIGGLDTMCVHKDSKELAIPVTHCVITNESMPRERICFVEDNGDSFDCQIKDDSPLAINIDKRNTVYLGQFRTILDAMFGVYEASSWELWIFMWYNAANGAPREQYFIVTFYILLFSFLVIFIQQSIFLVVIIESFADLRVESSSDSSKPVTDKPAIVLSDPLGQGNELHLTLIKKESSNAFQRKFNKYYYSWWRGWVGIETAFICLVIVDALVFASKNSGMSPEWGEVLYIWQIVVSVLFFLEISGVLVVHLRYKQPRLFFESKYFWFLMIIAVMSLVSAFLYRPTYASPLNVLAVSQATRGPRVLRLPLINQFFKRVFGNGSRLIMVTVAVLVLLGVFSVVAVQVFGYLPVETGCERTGSGQFSDFFTGLQSMFQLVMQEGWTEVMGEVMCHRDGSWVLINAAFIGLHLLGSLILLNIFVAAILDNLEYDDDTKRQKLEEDLKKQKVEKVPRDLKLFKQFGQKKISGPKISSIDVPNLTEADVRNFYNVGEATDFPVSYDNNPEPAHLVPDFSADRQSSVLSDIDLLTEDKSHLLRSNVSSHHGWYYGIQGILNYIKAFRQHSQAVEGGRRGQGLSGRSTVGGVGGQVDSTLLGQSEYEEYREKYRLFDSALFCLPPEHKLRRVCKWIITYRVSLPGSNPTNNPALNWRQIPGKWWSYFAYFIRYVVSSAPVFYWCIDLLTLSTLLFQASEFYTPEDSPNSSYIWISDLVFVLATLTELVLKIIVNGLLLNPNGALRSLWGILDWVIVLATLIVMIIYLVACGNAAPRFEVTFNPALVTPYMQALLTIRALRPIRMISLIPSMRRVVLDIIEGWRSFILALFVFLLFLFLFASLGVQLFAGMNSPQKFCNDPNMYSMEKCVGEFEIFIDISPHELIPTDDIAISMFVPRVWYDHRRDFQFENIGVALLTLFQVLTTEGWPQVRNLFDSEPFSTRPPYSWVMSIYIHLFVFIGVNIVLQLFVGIVVNNYNEHKPNHSALLTVSQKRWSDLVERISLTRPIKKPPVPRHSSVRKALYRVFSYLGYRNFSAFAALLSSAVFWVPWTIDNDQLIKSTMTLIYVSIGFSLLFIIELVLKLIAFGLNYFNSFRNVYDFLLSVLSVAFIAMASYYMTPGNTVQDGDSSTKNLELRYVTDMALSISVLRLFTILMKYRVFQNLMETVVKTIYRSLRLLFVLVMTSFMYSFVGALFFGGIRSGEALDYSVVNFNGILVSFNLVIRIMTGEDWYQILWDTMVSEPYCSDSLGNCGNVPVAIIWFISFYIIVSFFLINVFIAVLLENFSIFYEDDDTELNRSAVKDFKQNWFYFDKKATGKISSLRVKLFLRMLRIKEFYTYSINENGVKERQGSDVFSDSLLLREMAEELRRDHRQHGAKAEETGGSGLQQEVEPNKENHSFQNVLKMVAYRVEDISKRLVPHELYVREELEQSVQFDVAEDCIFKWMQRFVKPAIIKQEKHRRQTVAQLPRRIENKETVMWDPPSLNVPEDEWIDQQLSADSEDELDTLMTSLVLPSLQSSFLRPGAAPLTRSDDEMETEADVSEKERNVARSYAKLAELGPPIDPGRKDKWHDWIKMQSEWMDKVETDPDNYFDDYL